MAIMHLKEARRSLRVTQDQLSKALDCHRSWISMVENGHAKLSSNMEKLVTIALVVQYFVGSDEELREALRQIIFDGVEPEINTRIPLADRRL